LTAEAASFPLQILPKLCDWLQGGLVLFLGGTDVGKSTLIRALHERMGGEIVDGDVGQSWIGPPGVVSLGTPDHPRAGYFVGDVSPRGNLLQVTVGIALMAKRAERPCLIDTDGYIAGGAARAYKTELINLIKPDVLVLLQRDHELDYYKLFARKGVTVLDLAVSHQGLKTREERIATRERAFRSYFQQSAVQLRRWSLQEISIERGLLGCGEPISPEEVSFTNSGQSLKAGWRLGSEAAVLVLEGYAPVEALRAWQAALGVERLHLYSWRELQNRLVGCLCDGEFCGLGVLRSITAEQIEVLTPAERATTIQLGALRLDITTGRHERVRLGD
jgi:polynucleotide 5'-kinase involved in rRNA processing